jgi:hypothetical protein
VTATNLLPQAQGSLSIHFSDEGMEEPILLSFLYLFLFLYALRGFWKKISRLGCYCCYRCYQAPVAASFRGRD